MNLHVRRTEQQHDHIMEYHDLRNEFMIVTFTFSVVAATIMYTVTKGVEDLK